MLFNFKKMFLLLCVFGDNGERYYFCSMFLVSLNFMVCEYFVWEYSIVCIQTFYDLCNKDKCG